MPSSPAETLITRDCLSALQWNRRDVPADHYEGCRTAADDPRLGLYTFNSLKELDTRRSVGWETNLIN